MWDGITFYRCFRDTWIWQVSDIVRPHLPSVVWDESTYL